MISSFQDQTSDASGFASERSRTCLDYEASGVPPAQGQSGPWVFLNGFFLTDFSERKEKQPNLKGMVYFVSWIFWPPKSYVCWVVLLSLPKKKPFKQTLSGVFFWHVLLNIIGMSLWYRCQKLCRKNHPLGMRKCNWNMVNLWHLTEAWWVHCYRNPGQGKKKNSASGWFFLDMKPYVSQFRHFRSLQKINSPRMTAMIVHESLWRMIMMD